MNLRVARYAAMSLVCAMGASVWLDKAIAEYRRHREGDVWTDADAAALDAIKAERQTPLPTPAATEPAAP